MTTQISNGNEEPQPLSTHFSYGHHIILEPRPISYVFTVDESLINHAFRHIFARDAIEHWDELPSFPPDEPLFHPDVFHSIQDMDSVQKILKRYHCFVKTQAKKNKKGIIQDNDFKLTPDEIESLQNISEFMDLAERYQDKLSNILGECNNHVNPQCQKFNPHCHLLKTKDKINSNKFAQSIKLLDAPTGIFIVARASYIHNPNSRNPYKIIRNFAIKTGYRLWISKDMEARTKRFDRSERELQSLKDKLSSLENEKKHNPDFPVNIEIQKHFPSYI